MSVILAPWDGVAQGIYADGEMVIILFEAAATAKDGVLYTNARYPGVGKQNVVKAIAFLTRETSTQ